MSLIEELAADPAWYPNRLLVPYSQLEFRAMSAASYRGSPFLDQRIVTAGDAQQMLSFADIGTALTVLPERPAHFIYHNAFACSTLLTRYLDALNGPLLLREPNSLYEVATLLRFADTPMLQPLQHVSWEVLYQFVLRLLARRYRSDMPTIVKPTDGCNNLQERLLAAHADNRALYIYSKPARFMASVLRHQPRHEWVRVRVRELLMDVYKEKGAVPVTPESLSVSQAAALVWVLHAERFIRCAQTSNGRCVALDADDFMAAPAHALWRLCRHFGLDYSEDAIVARLADAQLEVHSKAANEVYDGQRRERDFAAARAEHGEEIDRSLDWAGNFCVQCNIGEALPCRLG